MSLSALTAMAVAVATVPNGEPPFVKATVDARSAAVEDSLTDGEPSPSTVTQLPIEVAQSSTGQLAPLPETAPGVPSSAAADTISQPPEPDQTIDPLQSFDPLATGEPEATDPDDAAGQSEIVVTGRKPTKDDPFEELNAQSFNATQSVDKAVIAPVAFAYEKAMPRPIRKGLRNFLSNLGEPIVFLNFLLQLKPGKAAETLGRFAVNTWIGVGGLVDVASRKPFNLPHRNNGFADTLGYYGVKPGPYFYLPLVGPTTLRDFIGDRLDLFILPAILPNLFRKQFIFYPIWTLRELDRRIQINNELTEIRASKDPYVAMRTFYLSKRQAEIDELRGHKVRTPPSKDSMPGPAAPSPVNYPPRTGSNLNLDASQTLAFTDDGLRELLVVGTTGGKWGATSFTNHEADAVSSIANVSADRKALSLNW